MTGPLSVGGLIESTDMRTADWVVSGVRDFDHTVGSLVPAGFAAHARLFHPAYQGQSQRLEEVRWRDVALRNGRVAHAGMEWTAITGSWRFARGDSQPGLWDHPPREGSLPVPQAARLAKLLEVHTSTPRRCWFAVWEGYGALAVPGHGAPRVQMPNRPMLLFSGPLAAVTTSLEIEPCDQRASLWWPEDRAWCVATDVDLMSTYVGGAQQCIAALVNDAQLEVLPVTADQSVTYDGDRLNPAPPREGP